MITSRFPLPVDERAVRALAARLSTIKHANGYYVDVTSVRRYRGAAQLSLVREPSEIHVVCGHFMRSEMPYEIIDRRSAAAQWWSSVPVSILFFLRSSALESEVAYRLMKAEILRCLLSAPIVDGNGVEYPIQVGPDPYDGDVRHEIRIYPLYIEDKPEYACGVMDINLLATFNLDSPYIASAGDSMIFASR